jgi:hypothetical protein
MRTWILSAFVLGGLAACKPGFEETALHGNWKNSEMEFRFNADKTMEMKFGLNDLKGTYRITMTNALELVNPEGKVVFNPHIKRIDADSLIIDIPNMGTSRIYGLAKVK